MISLVFFLLYKWLFNIYHHEWGLIRKRFFITRKVLVYLCLGNKRLKSKPRKCVGVTEKEMPDLFFKCLHSTNTSVKITEYRHCSLFQNSMYPKVFHDNIKISTYIPKHKLTKTDIYTVTAHNATQAAV